DLPGKKIGVVQGKTLHEIEHCYQRLLQLGVDKVAISFDYSLYEKLYPHENKMGPWCFGRVLLINTLIERGVIDYSIPHHLLGCSSPLEFTLYKSEKYRFLESLDTSNPIVHSILNSKYDFSYKLFEKPSVKLYELIEYTVTP